MMNETRDNNTQIAKNTDPLNAAAIINTNATKEAKSKFRSAVQSNRVISRIMRYLVFVLVAFIAGLSGSVMFSSINHSESTDSSSSSVNITSVTTESEAIAKVVDKVSPSVVSIVVSGTSTQTNESNWWTYGDGSQSYETSSAGTGLIISSDGYVITNKHVIGENTSSVKIVTNDGTEYDNVKVVGRDPLNDIAFLKINGVSGLTAAQFGDSSSVKVGSRVVAIGNALGEYQNTVTSGIISATGRTITAQVDSNSTETLTNLIQTDAAINSGNSGGPLVTLDGKVIGINTAIVEDAQGIGFSIPINEASGLIAGVLKNGKVERSYLGVRYVNITKAFAKEYNLPVEEGAYIKSDSGSAIISGSPADKAGIKDGDIITAVNGTKITSSIQLSSLTSSMLPGEEVEISILRDGKTITIKAELGVYGG